MIDMQKTGSFIAACRKEKGWTQKQLGEQVGVSDRAVSKWERGKSFPDISLLEPLGDCLGVTVSELLAGQHIEAEEYHLVTERMLVEAIGPKRLYRLEIAVCVLDVLAALGIVLPFLLPKDTFMPELNATNCSFWMIAIVLCVITEYLHKAIPAYEFRRTNMWIEGISGAATFALTVGGSLLVSGGWKAMQGESFRENLPVILIGLAGGAIGVGCCLFMAWQRRKAWLREQEKE
ncbi:MAG: helix-turn-helix domain-containing protein [Lachnospiraceae bacterium]|nr:helix-turn-helix domain-containing protein [Lachnospiraceae bacterium]